MQRRCCRTVKPAERKQAQTLLHLRRFLLQNLQSTIGELTC